MEHYRTTPAPAHATPAHHPNSATRLRDMVTFLQLALSACLFSAHALRQNPSRLLCLLPPATLILLLAATSAWLLLSALAGYRHDTATRAAVKDRQAGSPRITYARTARLPMEGGSLPRAQHGKRASVVGVRQCFCAATRARGVGITRACGLSGHAREHALCALRACACCVATLPLCDACFLRLTLPCRSAA